LKTSARRLRWRVFLACDHGPRFGNNLIKLFRNGLELKVAEIGSFQISGLPAWLLWSTAHIYFLVGFRNRIVVGANWLWNYITFERGARLITGMTHVARHNA
jgi:hypothetical protein